MLCYRLPVNSEAQLIVLPQHPFESSRSACSRIVLARLSHGNVHKARPHRRRSGKVQRQREDRLRQLWSL